MALDVIRIEEGRIAEIVTFPPQVFPAFRRSGRALKHPM
jgi:hypothetical protein